MATKVTLSDNVPITKDDNTPTTYFVRQLQLLLDETLAAAVAAAEADAAAAAAQATADAAVPQTRLINTTAPIAGGGALTSDLTLTHATSGVTAGSYTNANITVDAKGHVTVASSGSSGSTGTVTTVSVVTANGISGSVANPTTTPAITLTLGAITPTSVNASGTVLGSNLSGTNTGDQTSVSGNAGTATILQTARNFSITGGGITAAAVSFNGSAAVVLSASVDAGHITLARMANLAANSFIGNNTGSPATPIALTVAQAKTLLAISTSDVSGLGTAAIHATGDFLQTTNNLSDVTAATARTNLGLGTIATHAVADFVATPASLADQIAAARALGGCVVLDQSAVQVAHTGDLLEFTFATVTLPANAMGANGSIYIEAIFSHSSNANTKTPRIKFGGTTVAGTAVTASTQNSKFGNTLQNRNATNSQIFYTPGALGPYSAGNSAVFGSSAIDTTSNVSITITGQLGTNTDTIRLESYRILLYPKA